MALSPNPKEEKEDDDYRPWSDLHTSLLLQIVSHILQLIDYVRFTSVCSSWRSFQPFRLTASLDPCLITPCSRSGYYTITRPPKKDEFCHFLRIPGTSSCTLQASFFGWLLFSTYINQPEVERQEKAKKRKEMKKNNEVFNLFLFNPVTGTRIDLPSCNRRDYTSFLLSAPPTDPNSVFFMTASSKNFNFMFCRPGVDTEWSGNSGPEPKFSDSYFGYNYMVSCGRSVYFLSHRRPSPHYTDPLWHKYGVAYDLLGSRWPEVVTCSWLHPLCSPGCSDYICDSCDLYPVESSGEILAVIVYVKDYAYHFRVYKADEERKNWLRVRSLQDRILYLGLMSSVSIPASTTRTTGALDLEGGGNQIYLALGKKDSVLGITQPLILTSGPIKMTATRFSSDGSLWLQPLASEVDIVFAENVSQ